jgi:hypothetical protein
MAAVTPRKRREFPEDLESFSLRSAAFSAQLGSPAATTETPSRIPSGPDFAPKRSVLKQKAPPYSQRLPGSNFQKIGLSSIPYYRLTQSPRLIGPRSLNEKSKFIPEMAGEGFGLNPLHPFHRSGPSLIGAGTPRRRLGRS